MKCKCGKKAVVALNGQWFCQDCFEGGVKDVIEIIKRSIKGVKKATSPPHNPALSESP